MNTITERTMKTTYYQVNLGQTFAPEKFATLELARIALRQLAERVQNPENKQYWENIKRAATIEKVDMTITVVETGAQQ